MCLAHARGTEQEERIVPLPRLGDDDIRGSHRHLIGGALLEFVPSEPGFRYYCTYGSSNSVLHESRRFSQVLEIPAQVTSAKPCVLARYLSLQPTDLCHSLS